MATTKRRRLPIAAARDVAKTYGLRQVILAAWDGVRMHVVTYGKSAEDCAQAAEAGNRFKKALGWPAALQAAEPSRVRRLKARVAAQEAELNQLQQKNEFILRNHEADIFASRRVNDDYRRLLRHVADTIIAAQENDSDYANDSYRSLPDHLQNAVDAILEEHDRQLAGAAAACTDKAQIGKRHCPSCNAPRHGERCWKCDADTRVPAPEWRWPALPPIDRIRALAREVGYAIGVHGSQERDLDLIAAPWTANAVGSWEFVQHIAKGIGATVTGSADEKPMGRFAVNLQMDGWFKLIDLSVCPREKSLNDDDPHGWLVERHDRALVHYLWLDSLGIQWTPNSNKACRFARRADAEMAAAGGELLDLRIVKHLFWSKP